MPRVSKFDKDIGRIRAFIKTGYSFPQIAIALGHEEKEGAAIRQFIWQRNKKEKDVAISRVKRSYKDKIK